jgi:uncharacterized membrane protein YhiD involved in acid resistance
MPKRKNRYHKKAKMKGFLSGFAEATNTKGKLKDSALETGKDLLIGVIGGGVIGAIIGKPSLLVGLLTTGAGHYTNSRLIQLLGLGMMASNGFQTKTTVSGLEGLDGVKERLQAYQESFKEKFYLDKIMKKKEVSGFGEVQYFNYPESMGDLAALDDIERQLEQSALQFQGTANMGALNYTDEVGELEERLL